MDQNSLKQNVALAALEYIKPGMIIGVGSGSTVDYFISALEKIKGKIEGAVASSHATAAKLQALSIPVLDLNHVSDLPIYIDGADEVNTEKQMLKGGGGALAREKIIASVAEKFICIVDQSKQVDTLGKFPLAIEVLPMARSYVAREIVKKGGHPIYRPHFITDNGNVILDVYDLKIFAPLTMEKELNSITGTVMNGIFAARTADTVLVATMAGVKKF